MAYVLFLADLDGIDGHHSHGRGTFLGSNAVSPESRKGVSWSFVPFALSFFAYTAHWWTDTEGSLAAAVEEMRTGYDQLMIPVINNVPVLIVVIVLTIPIAILAMRLAEKVLKKPAAMLE